MTQSEKIYLVDDDAAIRDALGVFLENEGYNIVPLSTADELLDVVNRDNRGVVILDHYLENMSGLELQTELSKQGIDWPVIFISGSGDIALSVKAMKAGAMDFLEKPVRNPDLLNSVQTAFTKINELNETDQLKATAEERCHTLSEREREVMQHIVAGLSNARIARHLGLSIRTIEVHRANVNKKMGTSALVELVRMADLCGCQLET
jgi:FixJ family two-component response regulator